ncbi:hypothetical protein AVEN_15568-1 [Araneus ventricosus]|uniref:Uncharacterized protein n=1 Tax=Araneus ventricosus TaxID=182803 RepID=A0A4Y2FT85_ARAVE|nr:hypothetical protein AVEN_15568-1 [Araneus ventricosus]
MTFDGVPHYHHHARCHSIFVIISAGRRGNPRNLALYPHMTLPSSSFAYPITSTCGSLSSLVTFWLPRGPGVPFVGGCAPLPQPWLIGVVCGEVRKRAVFLR